MMIPSFATMMPVFAMIMPSSRILPILSKTPLFVLHVGSRASDFAMIIPALAKVVPKAITNIMTTAANVLFRFFIFSLLQFVFIEPLASSCPSYYKGRARDFCEKNDVRNLFHLQRLEHC